MSEIPEWGRILEVMGFARTEVKETREYVPSDKKPLIASRYPSITCVFVVSKDFIGMRWSGEESECRRLCDELGVEYKEEYDISEGRKVNVRFPNPTPSEEDDQGSCPASSQPCVEPL